MSLNDPLANVLSAIKNAEQRGQREVLTKNNSTLIRRVLDIMKANDYIADYEVIPDSRGGSLRIILKGSINDVGVIKPRYQIRHKSFERFEKRFLPARGFGLLIVSTNKGLMTHTQAREQNIGGTLISYVY